MSGVAPGWYKDPADPATQRYWDGEGWLGDPLPANAEPPSGPPPGTAPSVPVVISTSGVQAAAPPAPPTGTSPTSPRTGTSLTNPRTGTSPAEAGTPPSAPPGWPPGYPYPYPRSAPPPRPHGLALAGAGTRLAARLVDFLAVLLLCAIANAWFAYQWWQAFVPYFDQVADYQANGGTMPEAPEAISNLFLMMCVVASAVWFAYEVPGTANSGQTLGKRLVGIKVVRLESGDRVGFGRSLRRWGRLGLPTLLWPCFGIGVVLQFLDCLFVVIDKPLRQALHDKAATTVVVRVARPKPIDKNQLSKVSGGHDADSRGS